MTPPILVTGAAGFIGYHTSLKLLELGEAVIGIDNLNDYYDVELKNDRLKKLQSYPLFTFEKVEISNQPLIYSLFKKHLFKKVIHLAAQAGVRYSLTHPHTYIESNIVAFTNILEACKNAQVQHLVYASSSSIYGSNEKIPFSTEHRADNPISLYAATKKSNELMAHCYSHLYDIPTTGLRFFTVYGPWGRPDMAYFLFTKTILENEPIKLFNFGHMKRDFTYIDDVVEGILRVLENAPPKTKQKNKPPYHIYNIGNDSPVKLEYMIELIEKALGKVAKKELLPMQDGDVSASWANIDSLKQDTGFSPETPIEKGIEHFINWFCEYYNYQRPTTELLTR